MFLVIRVSQLGDKVTLRVSLIVMGGTFLLFYKNIMQNGTQQY